MASVSSPDVNYTPKLPKTLLQGERGLPNPHLGWDAHSAAALSAAQLEALVYAGQRHGMFNRDGTRCGFFIGDGTCGEVPVSVAPLVTSPLSTASHALSVGVYPQAPA